MKNAALSGVVLVSVLVLACSETPVAPVVGDSPAPEFNLGSGVTQHLSVGSNDVCPALGLRPGCDANFSLQASKWADGTVRGQLHDEFGRDADGQQLGGIHAALDCLEMIEIQVGIYTFGVAWVSGVVTQSTSSMYEVGDGVITAAVERGTSTQDLFEDLGTFTYPLSAFPAGTTCADMPDLEIFLGVSFTGQVTMWSR